MKFRSFQLQKRPISQGALLRGLALGCAIFAWFWLFVLSSQAWIFAAGFGVLGCVAAISGLRRPEMGRGDRMLLLFCVLLGMSACAMAIVGR